jgi:hypothetical protein
MFECFGKIPPNGSVFFGEAKLIYRFYWLLFPLCLVMEFHGCLLATDQVYPTVKFNESVYSITYWPLEDYWEFGQTKPEFMVQRTSNWCGYDSKWEIVGNRLWLVSFRGIVNAKEVILSDLFPGKERQLAAWFTGTLQLIKGEFGTGAIGRKVPEAHVMNVENGVVVNSQVFRPYQIRGPGKVGISLETVDGKLFAKSISSNGPVEFSKRVEIGDHVIGIRCDDWGERKFANVTVAQATGMIRGLADTQLNLLVRKPDAEVFEEVGLIRRQFFRN